MKKLVVGILAHVDAGKTTLSEAMLYLSGCLRRLGRVDHRDAFLDTNALERERGITIFSKQAVLPLGEVEVTLLDTPGHVDFSSEMERTLQVLDYAVLVISGTDGVQGHTRTVWRLLQQYRIPAFLFINKMDLAGSDRAALLSGLREELDQGCIDFALQGEPLWEELALCDEQACTRYLEEGSMPEEEVARLIRGRKVFPCYFGAALKLDGVETLLRGLEQYAIPPRYPEEFGARVYKIARDPQGGRLTYLKVTGGCLRVKSVLTNRRAGLGEDAVWEEKVDQLRIYSGARYQTVEEVPAGAVCAVTGLSRTYPGEGLGWEAAAPPPVLEPVLTYQLLLPEGYDPHTALNQLRQLAEEDPQLSLSWNGQLREIYLQLMGEVQMEVLQRLIEERFGLRVEFGPGNIVYRETIEAPVEGVGHFEPLRHYAEVHLLLEPGERGSGLRFDTACSEDQLDRNWQRLVLTHLAEREHPGVLTGSPVTDLKITLLTGRAHLKHTEGGDFRQATYRAVRQGLMRAKSILLEPWYTFRLELPAETVGRALSDLQRMSAETAAPETSGGQTVLTGVAPVACLRDYGRTVSTYTRGQGKLSCSFHGYLPCHNQEEVVAGIGYDARRDLDNPADSVFCSHGSGFVVPWDQVEEYMHLESGWQPDPPEPEPSVAQVPERRSSVRSGSLEEDRELQQIYERTYGPIKRRQILPREYPGRREDNPSFREVQPQPDTGPDYLLVDGYNIIFAWEELKAVARENLDAARQLLMDILSNYQGIRGCEVILVFDAYRVPRNTGEVSRYHNIHVVYTKEAETADAYIEKVTYEIARHHKVRVATSDAAEQLIILGHGALRLPAAMFRAEVEQVSGEIAAILSRKDPNRRLTQIKDALERAGRRQNRSADETDKKVGNFNK